MTKRDLAPASIRCDREVLHRCRKRPRSAILHLDGAPDGVHHTAELDQSPIARALDDAAVVHGDGRIDEVAAQGSQPCQGAILTTSRKAMTESFLKQIGPTKDFFFLWHDLTQITMTLLLSRQIDVVIDQHAALKHAEPWKSFSLVIRVLDGRSVYGRTPVRLLFDPSNGKNT